MDLTTIAEVGLEGSVVILIITISYKLYRMKCGTHSKCCGDQFEMDLENAGQPNNVSSI
tara:strand:+ start:347 stop:523 length:177 start_codon:yes stop_codon:yes gene_type:complete